MKNLVVLIDNGHGKDTKGKCSPDKTLYEWQWCREIACRLYKKLLENNIEAQLLVPEEKDISLKERVRREKKLTREAKAAKKETLFISIHINAAGGDGKWKTASGCSGYVANSASDKSKLFAQLYYKYVQLAGLQGNRSVPTNKYWEANFYVVSETSCPAVLTENMFQDNKNDVEYLKSEEGKNTIVDIHFNAIKEYIEK